MFRTNCMQIQVKGFTESRLTITWHENQGLVFLEEVWEKNNRQPKQRGRRFIFLHFTYSCRCILFVYFNICGGSWQEGFQWWCQFGNYVVLSHTFIKHLVAFLCCHIVFLDFSVGEGAFVIGLILISSFFSWFLPVYVDIKEAPWMWKMWKE